jgi:hypothetical protein
MSTTIHPAATDHVPLFITAPGGTDILFNIVIVFAVFTLIGVMILYFRIHALPEHIAHGSEKIQYEVVAVLALISLFTHNHIYWILGLLLALVRLPDFTSPLTNMADSLAKMVDKESSPPAAKVEPVAASAKMVDKGSSPPAVKVEAVAAPIRASEQSHKLAGE